MNRCGRASALMYPLALLALLPIVGCGEDELTDEAYGAIDLTPFYADGATAADPRAAVPAEIRAQRGWYEGLRTEMYDFGLVNHRRKRNSAGATIREPDIAFVNPMYFFYDSGGNPLFSKPIYDQRTGVFFMKGGQKVLNPNPRGGDSAVYYATPYSQRQRDVLGNFQRPIIDKLANDSTYTGLWEIVAVTVQGGYEPDSIKSWKTLQKAKDAGKVTLQRTLKVVNCPVIEERTWVIPSGMAYRQGQSPWLQIQPRIELWYRTKLGFCYMANGFETIGDVAAGKDPRWDANEIYLWKNTPDDNANRIDTFDVIRYAVGEGTNRVDLVEVPVGKVYSPRVSVNSGRSTSNIRYVNDEVISAIPRHFAGDPPGYSPILWHYDTVVPQDPPFVAGTFKKLSDIDPGKITPRDTDTTVWTRNYPVGGVQSKCTTDAQCPGFGMTCNNLPDFEGVTNDPPAGQGNIADFTISREGGPRCDIPAVSFGEYCAPGVSRCLSHTVADDPNDKALGALKVPTGGTTLGVHKALADAIAAKAKVDADPMATDMQKMTAASAVTTAQSTADRYKGLGYPVDLAGRGYICQPNTSAGGYCYIRCDGGANAGTAPTKDSPDDLKLNAMLEVSDPRRAGPPRMEPTKFGWDTRCGGLELLGYKCLPGTGRPNRQKVCMRECTTRSTEAFNKSLCNYFVKAEGLTSTTASFSGAQGAVESLAGQTCGNYAGITACQWNVDFEPRDPATMLPPK